MPVRTAHRDAGLLFVSHGRPHPDAAVALADNGLVFYQGLDRWLVPWSGLDSVRVRAKGTFMADQPWMIVGAVGLVRWTYTLLSGLLFVLTIGGLGGGGWQLRRGLDISPMLKNRPPAFALTYAIDFLLAPPPDGPGEALVRRRRRRSERTRRSARCRRPGDPPRRRPEPPGLPPPAGRRRGTRPRTSTPRSALSRLSQHPDPR